MKRILCLLLAVMMLVGMCAVLGSCGDESDPAKCEHVNNDADGKCDKCGTKMKHDHEDENEDGKCDFCSKSMGDEEEEIIDYPWLENEKIQITVMMSHADNGDQNPSGCERYLAGETSDEDSVDKLVDERNEDVEELVNVHATYKYYPQEPANTYDWSKINILISSTIKSGKSEGIPDIFVNFTYDLLACSLKGCFQNLKDETILTNGATLDGNYFEFIDEDYNEEEDNRGYMLDYMNSTTLSQQKVYILASDYFIDLIRSFFIVPVNIALLESVGMEVTGDLNGDEKFTIDDFYQEVMEKGWTYDKVAEYSDAIHEETGTVAGDDLEDVLGFAIGKGGVATNGIIYSTDIHVIDKVWDETKGDYEYDFPATCETLFDIYDAVNLLVGKKGVYVVTPSDPSMTTYGQSPWLAVRTRFCNNQILFGDIILIGALEFPQYQDLLNNGSGFGVVPVPNYHEFQEGERYVTCIHNTARPGAITLGTKNFTACTAFLNYLSTHSSDVLETYYNINLQYQFTMGDAGTTEMLQYIRLNVRSSFDKLVEDAVGLFGDVYNKIWGYPMTINNYQYTEIRKFYSEHLSEKNDVIDGLYAEYPNLP